MSNDVVILTDKIMERFWDKVEKTDTCWIWKGAKHASGYGRFKIDNKLYYPHRITYEVAKGKIPPGAIVCHNCPGGDNAQCCNPDHMFIGNHEDNRLDYLEKLREKHFQLGNPTKFYGVRYDSSRKEWISYVYIDKKLIDIGRSKSEVDAARNHDRIAMMRYGRKNRLNFPQEYRLELVS